MATKRKRRPLVSDQVRRAIAEAGVTRYRIAQETGIAQSTLSKFMSGKEWLSGKALDAIGAYLDLEVVRHGPDAS